jgi:hypothetical protein
MSDSNTWMKVRKIEVFDKATKVNLLSLMGNKEELEKYSEKKNSGDYCLYCWQEITCPNVKLE